ncbi:MAG: D-inositol-3-phosphate glycosyltransferase [candidate division WS2 bacterium ADurb.Bin280]|uniref:D-inositol-3-phosphate glycosyltransferase n=1 Tax=candidate division WS2 bacterium ADurb.Bin280 TaxID=1852829 RepID=A0A1V5SEA0_9BACT|nr:MAG: D-inositol-3-phosphate glycosyltransferase [candidate division WS2 bacterium ADurb.Bin280]
MKILIVSLWEISDNSIGGTERYVVDLAESLARKGILVDVLMLSGKYREKLGVKYFPLEKGLDVNEYEIKNRFFSDFNNKKLSDFAEFIEGSFDANDYDLIHLNSLLFLHLYRSSRRVFTLHENPFEFDHNWGRGSLKKIKQIIAADKLVHNFIVPSSHYASKYNDLFRFSTTAIPHSIDVSRLRCAKSKEDILRKYNLKNILTFVVPSRMEIFQKGQDLAAKALGMIKDDIPDFQVVFSGLDNQYIKNVEIIQNICLSNKIKASFLNFDNISEAYKIADVIILPSKSESFGYSALESLSLGKRTVLSDIPTFEELASYTPLAIISRQNPEDFSKNILRAFKVTKDEEMLWLKNFDQDEWADKYITYYEKLLQR